MKTGPGLINPPPPLLHHRPHQKSSFKSPPSRCAIDLPEAGPSAGRGCGGASEEIQQAFGDPRDRRTGEGGSVQRVLVSIGEDACGQRHISGEVGGND